MCHATKVSCTISEPLCYTPVYLRRPAALYQTYALRMKVDGLHSCYECFWERKISCL